MGVVTLIVVGGVPAEVVGRDVHSGGDIVAIGPEQIPPHLGIVISKTRGVLPFQGENMRPHISVVLIQLPHGLLQIHSIFITKETVVTQPFRPGPGGDVLHIAL